MMAAMRGYKAVITTSPKCSQEKMDSIRAYGATLVVRPSPHTRCPARALTAIAMPAPLHAAAVVVVVVVLLLDSTREQVFFGSP